ncbi:MAG: FAD-binding oxidoreductase [Gammaproteobacteria bacterium]|nr:FAD-binding oxidoreductase [Gammaproteobacteria bacterium]
MRISGRAKTGEFQFACGEGERILYAGLHQGVPLPYECASGTCGTCRARLASGKIKELWPDAPGRKHVKPEREEFLMCQATAVDDCEILVPAKIPLDEVQQPRYNLPGELIGFNPCTHDVATFSVRLSEPIQFHAGQFVVIHVPAVGGYRAYSMTNYAQTTNRLDFVIKKMPGGGFSEWLFEADREGTRVNVFGPLGAATLSAEDGGDFLCIAGGSGIAGMMSILSFAEQQDVLTQRNAQVFFGVRTLNDRFFLDELSRFARKFPDRVRITVALSDEEVTSAYAESEGLYYESGFVHEVAGRHIPENSEHLITFIAGPPPMVDGAIRMLLVKHRIPATRIRYDKFS